MLEAISFDGVSTFTGLVLASGEGVGCAFPRVTEDGVKTCGRLFRGPTSHGFGIFGGGERGDTPSSMLILTRRFGGGLAESDGETILLEGVRGFSS